MGGSDQALGPGNGGGDSPDGNGCRRYMGPRLLQRRPPHCLYQRRWPHGLCLGCRNRQGAASIRGTHRSCLQGCLFTRWPFSRFREQGQDGSRVACATITIVPNKSSLKGNAMYNRTLQISSLLLCVSLCQVAWAGGAKENLTHDVKLLQDAGVATDGPGLLQFIRKKTLSEDQRRNIKELIQQL